MLNPVSTVWAFFHTMITKISWSVLLNVSSDCERNSVRLTEHASHEFLSIVSGLFSDIVFIDDSTTSGADGAFEIMYPFNCKIVM